MKKTEKFSDLLRNAIASSGLSYRQLAKATGVSISTISRFMSGESDITLAKADKILSFIASKDR